MIMPSLKKKHIRYILENHKEKSVKEMEKATGAKYQQIYDYLRRNNLSINKKGFHQYTEEPRFSKALNMLLEGWYLDDIIQETGLSRGMILNAYIRIFRTSITGYPEHYPKTATREDVELRENIDYSEMIVCESDKEYYDSIKASRHRRMLKNEYKKPIIPYCWKDIKKKGQTK